MAGTLGSTRRISACPCLNCAAPLDAANAIDDDASPSPGDITMCIRCGHIMAFADDLRFRDLNDEEAFAIAGDDRLLKASKALAIVWEKHGKPGTS